MHAHRNIYFCSHQQDVLAARRSGLILFLLFPPQKNVWKKRFPCSTISNLKQFDREKNSWTGGMGTRKRSILYDTKLASPNLVPSRCFGPQHQLCWLGRAVIVLQNIWTAPDWQSLHWTILNLGYSCSQIFWWGPASSVCSPEVQAVMAKRRMFPRKPCHYCTPFWGKATRPTHNNLLGTPLRPYLKGWLAQIF